MARLAELPKDMVFFTQITMEAAEDTEFLDAMRKARIKGALVGVEAVTAEGLKAVFKDFNQSGEDSLQQLQTFRSARRSCPWLLHFWPSHGPAGYVRGDGRDGSKSGCYVCSVRHDDTVSGHCRFSAMGEVRGSQTESMIGGTPITRYWLIPPKDRPKMFTPHPTMSPDEIRERTQGVWDRVLQFPFYLDPIELRFLGARPAGVRSNLQAVPSDVCEDRNLH